MRLGYFVVTSRGTTLKGNVDIVQMTTIWQVFNRKAISFGNECICLQHITVSFSSQGYVILTGTSYEKTGRGSRTIQQTCFRARSKKSSLWYRSLTWPITHDKSRLGKVRVFRISPWTEVGSMTKVKCCLLVNWSSWKRMWLLEFAPNCMKVYRLYREWRDSRRLILISTRHISILNCKNTEPLVVHFGFFCHSDIPNKTKKSEEFFIQSRYLYILYKVDVIFFHIVFKTLSLNDRSNKTDTS